MPKTPSKFQGKENQVNEFNQPNQFKKQGFISKISSNLF